MVKIKSLQRYGNEWFWRLEYDSVEDDGVFFTNRSGEGLFYRDDRTGSIRQLEGTCQFRACDTVSGMRRKIKRIFCTEDYL